MGWQKLNGKMRLCATPCRQVPKALVARQSRMPCTTYSGTLHVRYVFVHLQPVLAGMGALCVPKLVEAQPLQTPAQPLWKGQAFGANRVVCTIHSRMKMRELVPGIVAERHSRRHAWSKSVEKMIRPVNNPDANSSS